MPFICEAITNDPLYKKSATPFSKDHIKIKPLSRPSTSLGTKLVLKSCFMPAVYRQYADAIQNFEVFADDIWIISFPKSGTIDTQELVWLLLNGLDFERAQSVPLKDRSFFLEETTVRHPKLLNKFKTSIDIARRAKTPRLIKTHLPVALLPKQLWKVKPKTIYIARNPKDVFLAYHQEYQHLHGYQGNLKDFLEIFLADNVISSPYHSHIIDFWSMKDESNILFLEHEDIKRDYVAAITTITTFLEKPQDEEDVEKLSEYLSNLSMNTDTQNSLTQVWGSSKAENGIKPKQNGPTQISSETEQRLMEWNANKLKTTDFQFKY